MKVTRPKEMEFERGRRSFREGHAAPAKPFDPDFNPPTLQACRWLGWMVERAVDWDKRRNIADQLNVPRPDIAEYREQ